MSKVTNAKQYLRIGNLIKDHREALGLSQQEIADYVGVTKSAISRWESGEVKNMGRSKIQKLSEILEISPVSIVSGEEIQNNAVDESRGIGMLNEKLRTLRIAKGVTQNEVANLLGIDRTTYTKYETGDSNPDYGIICKLADYFNVTVDYNKEANMSWLMALQASTLLARYGISGYPIPRLGAT